MKRKNLLLVVSLSARGFAQKHNRGPISRLTGAGAAAIMRAMRLPTAAPFFIASYAWNFAFGISMLVVPLYAHDLGMSGTQIGVLLGFPVVAQIMFGLAGGAFIDRVGSRAMQLFSFGAMAIAGVVFSLAHSFLPLLLGQLFVVFSRAIYWPASQTIASILPGERGTQIGRLSAVTNVGQITGTAIAGVLLAQWSFVLVFVILAVTAAMALVLGVRSPVGQRSDAHRATRVFAHFGPLLRRRMVYFSIACSYLAALPISLSQSFYPILLVEFGFPAEAAGGLLSLRSAGAVTASLVIARYLKSITRHALPFVATLCVAASIGLIPLFVDGIAVAVLLLAGGIGSGVMTIYYQLVVSEVSSPLNRGSAMALGGLGWGLSHLSTPLVMGFLVDTIGIADAFHVWGLFALLMAMAFLPMHRWALREAGAAVAYPR